LIDHGMEILSPEPAGVPAELRSLRRWVLWRLEERGARRTKVPLAPARRPASTADPATWSSFEEAWAAYAEGGFDGIGLVFAAEDGYTGIDLDGAVDAGGRVEPWAREWLERLSSYTELSPSGRGLHVIVRARLPGEGRRAAVGEGARVELYDRGRYFTVTGRRPDGVLSPPGIEARQEAVEELYGSLARRPAERPAPPRDREGAPPGLADERIIELAGRSRSGEKFSRLWAGDTAGYASESEADLALCSILSFYTGPDAARIDRLFRRSGLCREKWERRDYRERTIALALAGRKEFYGKGGAAALEVDGGPGRGAARTPKPSGGAGDEKPTPAQRLVERVEDAGTALWHAPDGEPYVSPQIAGHRETYAVRSRAAKRWLAHAYFLAEGRPPPAQALADAINLLDAKAYYLGAEEKVHVRIGGDGGALLIDLGDRDWRQVTVTAEGWQVEPHTVRFRRGRGLRPLPEPERGGSLEELCGLLGLEGEAWRLAVTWLAAALRPRGPYPVLVLLGEAGSGKSTRARMLRDLVDPSAAPLRSEPRDVRDLMIAAAGSWVLALDNLSGVQPWLSDALCRLSTGGGFATRELYTDQEEVIIDVERPVVLTGIEDVVSRGDLLDRSLLVTLQAMPEEERRPERELLERFEAARPRLLGALLDAVSAALRELPAVRLERLPRLADYALWAVALERALGWPEGSFLEAYRGNRHSADATALEADPIAAALEGLVAEAGAWVGTATELLEALGERVGEEERRGRAWPRNARTLAGRLRRLAPNLRRLGVDVECRREGRGRQRLVTLRRMDKAAGFASAPSAPSAASSRKDLGADGRRTVGPDPGALPSAPGGPFGGPADGADGADGSAGGSAARKEVWVL
jgi:primase-polymerase (primpol)-like protein